MVWQRTLNDKFSERSEPEGRLSFANRVQICHIASEIALHCDISLVSSNLRILQFLSDKVDFRHEPTSFGETMARRRNLISILCALNAAVWCGSILQAQAQGLEEPEPPAEEAGSELWFEVTTAFTTDYVFRGISQTSENPAVQPELVVGHGMFFAGIWGSNVDWGADPFVSEDLASVEIDYFAGIAPEWRGISFELYGLYYTFPGACEDECAIPENDYFELATSAKYTFVDKLEVKVQNYWTWENYNETGEANAFELSSAYEFDKWWMFTPSLRGLVGWQWFEELDSYTYWNVGFDLKFLDNWTAKIDYWDTADLICAESGPFACDARVVGTLEAKFEY